MRAEYTPGRGGLEPPQSEAVAKAATPRLAEKSTRGSQDDVTLTGPFACPGESSDATIETSSAGSSGLGTCHW